MSVLRVSLGVFCALVLLALVLVPFVQVVMREVFGAPIIGAEELTRFLLIVLVFAAFPLVVHERENIVMAEMRDALPRRARLGLVRLSTLLGASAGLFMAYVGWATIMGNLSRATPTLGIPLWLFFGAATLAFAGAAVAHIAELLRSPRPERTRAL